MRPPLSTLSSKHEAPGVASAAYAEMGVSVSAAMVRLLETKAAG
jgi:hypothetical protein